MGWPSMQKAGGNAAGIGGNPGFFIALSTASFLPCTTGKPAVSRIWPGILRDCNKHVFAVQFCPYRVGYIRICNYPFHLPFQV